MSFLDNIRGLLRISSSDSAAAHPDLDTSLDQPTANSGRQEEKDDDGGLFDFRQRMPIDTIYNYLDKSFEEQGRLDALTNPDKHFRERQEKIYIFRLKRRMEKATMAYLDELKILSVRVRNAEEDLSHTSAELLKAQMEIYEKHLEKIREMERLLEAGDPSMTTMVETYRRGFQKGIAIATFDYICRNNNLSEQQ